MGRAKDSNSGKVELFNPEGGRIRFARYSQVAARVKMVEEWLKECSGTGYTLAITPDIDLPPWEMAEIIREEQWRELKRKMGDWSGEKCEGVRTEAENATVERFTARFTALRPEAGQSLTKGSLDEQLDKLQKIA